MKLLTMGELRNLIVLFIATLGSQFGSRVAIQWLARNIGDIEWSIRRRSRNALAGGLASSLGYAPTSKHISKLTREIFRNKIELEFLLWRVRSGTASPTVNGLEHLEAALDLGRGAILWECNFGNRLLAKATLADCGFLLSQVHADAHWGSATWVGQHLVKRYRRQTEERLFPEMIDITDDSLAYVRRMINRLNQNGIICISAFGQRGQKFVTAEFLGRQRRFSTGAITLSKMTGAPIIPLFCFRADGGKDSVILEKPVFQDQAGDTEQAAMDTVGAYIKMLESYIYRYPANWYAWRKSPRDARTDHASVGIHSAGKRTQI